MKRPLPSQRVLQSQEYCEGTVSVPSNGHLAPFLLRRDLVPDLEVGAGVGGQNGPVGAACNEPGRPLAVGIRSRFAKQN